PLESVTVNDSVNVPLTGCVMVKEPVPWYGPVPPVPDTVHVNGLPAVIELPTVPHMTLTTKGCWTTVTVVVATAVFPLASLTSKDSWNDPLTGSVTVNVPVPRYGPVPPVADTLHVNGLPAVIAADEEPQETVTTNGCWRTVTLVDATAVLPFASFTLKDSVN